MDIQLIKNLLIKISIDGSHGICDTCIQKDNDGSCIYRSKNKCTNYLEEYVPDKDVINS